MRISKRMLACVGGGIFLFMGFSVIQQLRQDAEHKKRLTGYRLPERFQMGDLKAVVDHMKSDPDFSLYFQMIPEPYVQRTIEEIAVLLGHDASRVVLERVLQELQGQVKTLATFFNSLDIPGDFSEEPQKYPKVQVMMGKFFYEEFKLTILGVCYRSNVNSQFQFQWDRGSREAAVKLRGILLRSGKDSLRMSANR